MTEHYAYRATVNANWKLFMDAFQEFYHAPYLHGGQTPRKFTDMIQEFGFEAPYYEIERPAPAWSRRPVSDGEDQPKDMIKPIEDKLRSGLFGRVGARPSSSVDEQAVPGVNPGGCDPVGPRLVPDLSPNFVILIWAGGWYLTYHYWPTAVNSHVFEANLYFVPAKNATRAARPTSWPRSSFKEYGLQDANTLEATQTMLESRVITEYVLNDQEVLCRHLHKESRDAVEAYKRELEGARSDERHARCCRASSPTSSPSQRPGAWPPRRSASTGAAGEHHGRHAALLRRGHGPPRRSQGLPRHEGHPRPRRAGHEPA